MSRGASPRLDAFSSCVNWTTSGDEWLIPLMVGRRFRFGAEKVSFGSRGVCEAGEAEEEEVEEVDEAGVREAKLNPPRMEALILSLAASERRRTRLGLEAGEGWRSGFVPLLAVGAGAA